jgi:hypothetical protein
MDSLPYTYPCWLAQGTELINFTYIDSMLWIYIYILTQAYDLDTLIAIGQAQEKS